MIKPYQESDLTAVTSMMTDLGYPTTTSEMARRIEQIRMNGVLDTYVAHLEGAAAGLISLQLGWSIELPTSFAQVVLLVVKQEYEGRGVGTRLMVYAEEWASNNGAEFITLTSGIKPERERAHRLYEHLGYQVNGCRFVKPLTP